MYVLCVWLAVWLSLCLVGCMCGIVVYAWACFCGCLPVLFYVCLWACLCAVATSRACVQVKFAFWVKLFWWTCGQKVDQVYSKKADKVFDRRRASHNMNVNCSTSQGIWFIIYWFLCIRHEVWSNIQEQTWIMHVSSCIEIVNVCWAIRHHLIQ